MYLNAINMSGAKMILNTAQCADFELETTTFESVYF